MKKALKIVLYIIGGLLLLVLGAVGFLLTNPGKNFVRKQAISFLHDKLKTEVRVGGLDYSLPKWLELKDVLFLDQNNDTLLAAGTLRVDIAMLKLISGTVQVNKVNFEHGVAHIYRTAPDTVFNFDYIVKAFASPSSKEEKPVDTSGGLVLDIRELALKDIRFRFDDYTGGSRFGLAVNELVAEINKTDINKMDFGLKRFYVNGLTSTFNIDTSYLPKSVDTSSSPLPKIAADELDLNNVNFTFVNSVDPFLFNIALGKLLLHPKTIDLNNNYITLNDLTLDTTNVKIVMGKTSKIKPVEVEYTTTPAAKWRVLANTIKLNGVNFKMDDENKPAQQYGIDYAHLDVQQLKLDLEQLLYATDTIAGNVKHLSVKEKSGLDLQELRTVFAYYPQGAYLNKLYVKTPHTVLQDHVSLKYPSLDALSKNMQQMQLKLNLQNSMLGMSDVLIFVPDLRKQDFFKRYGNDHLKLNAAIEGYVNALNIGKFQLQGLNNTTFVDISGKLNGLPDANKLNYNVAIKRLQSTKSTVMVFMPASAQQQVDLPNSFNITGRLSGNVKDYNPDLLARTTDGNIIIRGKLYMSPGEGREKYDLVLKTESLNIGKIIRKDSMLGRISANIKAKGQSFDINRMDAILNGEIYSAGFMGYNYQAISFDGKMAGKQGYVTLISKDPNLVMNLDAQADLRNQYPALVARLKIDSADFQALQLSKEELRVRAIVDVDAPELNPDYPRGSVNIDRPTVVMSGTRYSLDSLYLSSQPNADSGNFIVMDADAIQAVITGKTPLSRIGDIMQAHINRYYGGDTVLTPEKPLPANYNLNLTAIVRDRPLMHVLLPGLVQMDTIGVRGALDPNSLTLNVGMPKLQYKDMYLYNGVVNAKGTGNALNYDVSLDKFKQGKDLEIVYASLYGTAANKTVTANLSIADTSKEVRFALGASYRQNGDTQLISMLPGLKLNYDDWQVRQPNTIALGKEGFYVQNLHISRGGESIVVNSETPQFSAPIVAAINSFFISNITEIISRDTLLANGELNMNMRLQDIMKNPKASGTLNIANLSFLGDTIGNLDVKLNEASANAADARIAINGRGNDIVLTGYYYPTPVNGNNFDLNMAINAINVQSMEGLAQHQIKNTSGYIRGNLKIQGTIAAPKVIGELRTDNLQTTVASLGAQFKFPAERIEITPEGIAFKNFKIVDSFGNTGMIDGKIITRDFKDMRLALRVTANKLQVLNSTPKDNELFYGRMVVSTNMNVKGPLSAPDLSGSLTIHDTTKFTVAMPEKQIGIQDREGIVEFVNMRDTASLGMLRSRDTMPKIAMRKGANLDLNIGIEKNAEFNVIIDQGTGDFLRVRGEASLNTNVRRDGSIGLAGTYELKDGAYELNYNLIKRKFKIQPGSVITFAGDPLDADVKITAVYTANIAPYDLVAKQVDNPDQLNYFKQRLPFEVRLNMTGNLMKPTISFDVVLPEDKSYAVSADVTSLVQAKLTQVRNDASELNKQVFAVLILGRFVSDNPFESGGGGSSAEYIARQSVSRFIGEQLNKFADQLVQGLELTFDLQSTEDYTTGAKRNRTDLNVAASKRLLNDRLTLTVGNNFELEGQNQNKNQNTSLIPGNLAADYQLSKDGRYLMRIYRRNEMEDILQGFVVETGTSFVVTLNYNKFSNLFNRKKRMAARMNNRSNSSNANTPKGTSN